MGFGCTGADRICDRQIYRNLLDGTFLNYGQNFGLSSPVELNLGFIILTFGLEFNITIASVIGVIISFVVYRFIR